jgi:hypothetical protein
LNEYIVPKSHLPADHQHKHQYNNDELVYCAGGAGARNKLGAAVNLQLGVTACLRAWNQPYSLGMSVLRGHLADNGIDSHV